MVVEVPHRTLHATFERLLQRPEETIMSTAEKLRREGLEEGLATGLATGEAKGRAEILTRLLTGRFGPLPQTVIQRLTAGTIAELDRWAERLLDAASLAEVFADS